MQSIKSMLRSVLFLFSIITPAHAQEAVSPPDEKDVIAIIAAYDDINSRLYQVVHITPGEKQDEDGFTPFHQVRITAFAPESAGRPRRQLKYYLLEWSDLYGWFIQRTRQHSVGTSLEIHSQKKGKVIVR
jgi:hypothetical protein